jgi:hypothetical protein
MARDCSDFQRERNPNLGCGRTEMEALNRRAAQDKDKDLNSKPPGD